MVDFATLPPAGRSRSPEKERAESYEKDEAFRDAWSRKAVVVTLDHEPEMQGDRDGNQYMILRGPEAGAKASLKALYMVPPRVVGDPDASDAFNGKLRSMGGGDKVTLVGHWSKTRQKGEDGVEAESWHFRAHNFAQGEKSLEQVMEMARRERRGLSAEPERVSRDASRTAGALASQISNGR